MKKNLGVIVGGTTFVLFKEEEGETPSPFKFPNNKELGKLALIVAIFSVMNGVIINEIKKTL